MKFPIRLMILGLGLVNGLTVGSADIFVDGQVIQGTDISSISIDPISGDITVAAGGLYTVTRDGDPPPGPQVVINSLTANPSTILEGESTVISWTTTDADGCTPSQGAGGWDQQTITLPSGSSDALTISTPGLYTFRLDCENDTPDTASRTVNVQVNEDTPPPPPTGECPEGFIPPLMGDTITWESWASFPWPDPEHKEKAVGIDRAGYLAVEFNTGDNPGLDGSITTVAYAGVGGSRLGAISHCPGDFSQELPDTFQKCSREYVLGGSIKWSTETSPAFNECELQPNTTYYINLTFTDGEDPATDQCVNAPCRTILVSSY